MGSAPLVVGASPHGATVDAARKLNRFAAEK